METTSLSLSELTEIMKMTLDDLDDLEIFCVCTGTCVTLKCIHG